MPEALTMSTAKVTPFNQPNTCELTLGGARLTGEKRSAYEDVLEGLHSDPKVVQDIEQGKRIGFYRFRGNLGEGNFSTVKLAIHQLTKDKVAVKIIEKAKLDTKTQKMMNREIKNMDTIWHPNIIRLFEVVETDSRVCLVMEFAPGGELYNKVTSSGYYTEPDAQDVFRQVVTAVEYLHSRGIFHRDIKAENVFVSRRRAKLGDFGFSTRVKEMQETLTTFCGSPPYAAPELYKDECYEGGPVDVWALGVLLFFIITGDMPFKGATVSALKRQITSGTFLIPVHVSPVARDLLNDILVQNPQHRPSAETITLHPWLSPCIGSVSPMPEYVLTPRPNSPTLTKEEHDAYVMLESWGISKKILKEEASQGARSSTVATYRIYLYSLMKEKDQDNDVSEEDLMKFRRKSSSSLENGNSRPGSSKMELNSRKNGPAHAHNKSKACDIL